MTTAHAGIPTTPTTEELVTVPGQRFSVAESTHTT